MKTETTIIKLRVTFLSLLVLLILGLSGCATVGTVVPQERRIPLAETQNSAGTFKQGSLTIAYSYSLTGTNMALHGKAHYMGGADALDIRIVFIDMQGKTIEQKLVYGTSYRATRGGQQADRNFEKTLAVPAGTTGFSFIYTSESRSGHR